MNHMSYHGRVAGGGRRAYAGAGAYCVCLALNGSRGGLRARCGRWLLHAITYTGDGFACLAAEVLMS